MSKILHFYISVHHVLNRNNNKTRELRFSTYLWTKARAAAEKKRASRMQREPPPFSSSSDRWRKTWCGCAQLPKRPWPRWRRICWARAASESPQSPSPQSESSWLRVARWAIRLWATAARHASRSAASGKFAPSKCMYSSSSLGCSIWAAYNQNFLYIQNFLQKKNYSKGKKI